MNPMMISSNSTVLVEYCKNEASPSYFHTSTSIFKNLKVEKIIINLNLNHMIVHRYPKEEAKFKCFETDAIPVYPDKIFDGYCSDIHGNKYQENSTVTSCCECLL